MAAIGDTWYRFEDRRYSIADDWGEHSRTKVEIVPSTLTVGKVTSKGVWLQDSWDAHQPVSRKTARFVLLSATKRYAHATKKEALEALLARKRVQQRILEANLANVDKAVSLVKNLLGVTDAATEGLLALVG